MPLQITYTQYKSSVCFHPVWFIHIVPFGFSYTSFDIYFITPNRSVLVLLIIDQWAAWAAMYSVWFVRFVFTLLVGALAFQLVLCSLAGSVCGRARICIFFYIFSLNPSENFAVSFSTALFCLVSFAFALLIAWIGCCKPIEWIKCEIWWWAIEYQFENFGYYYMVTIVTRAQASVIKT